MKQRIVIAFSGGADSTALLHHALATGNEVTAITVDHALREESAVEAAQCAEYAESLGANSIVLRWQHDGVESNIQKRARNARYGLMGDWCRENGVSEIWTGHHYDDMLETVYMREPKGYTPISIAGMSERTYAPVWPELRDIFIVRPFLNKTHEMLVNYCLLNDLKWVEDPSNNSDKYERNRARKVLNSNPFARRKAEKSLSINKKLASKDIDYYDKCLKKAVFKDGYVTIESDMMKNNTQSFGNFIRCLVMAQTSRSVEPGLKSYNNIVQMWKSGGNTFTLANSLITISDGEIIVEARKMKKGQKPVSICDHFKKRMEMRYIR